MVLKEGAKFPPNIEFNYIPIDLQLKEQDPLACERPLNLNLDKLFEKYNNSNILIVSVPGAFTPTCTEDHIPPFLQQLATLKSDKNIGVVLIISANDAFVLNAWGKLLLKEVELKGDLPQLVFASDPNASFSRENDLSVDVTANGLGVRTARYAIVIDSNRTVKYLGKEIEKKVELSGVDAILNAKL